MKRPRKPLTPAQQAHKLELRTKNMEFLRLAVKWIFYFCVDRIHYDARTKYNECQALELLANRILERKREIEERALALGNNMETTQPTDRDNEDIGFFPKPLEAGSPGDLDDDA